MRIPQGANRDPHHQDGVTDQVGGRLWPWGLSGMGIKSHNRVGRRVMTKGRRVQVGALLILVGAAFIVLNLWFLTTVHWVPDRRGGYGVLIAIGLTMLVAGTMVLLGC